MVARIHADVPPFDCVWCAVERRHDRCTGKALRAHSEYRLLHMAGAMTKVADCRCALHGHPSPSAVGE